MSITFEQLIQHNKRRSWILVGSIAAFTAFMFGVFAVTLAGSATPEEALPVFSGAAAIGAIVAIVGSLLSYFLGSFVILGISNARKVDYSTDRVLHNVVEEMAIAAGVPKPKIYAIHDESPNAFATGRSPKHAIIGITTGLRKKLDRDELQAVIAHEMAHIKNYDIRLMMLVGVFAGIIVLVSDFFLRGFFDTMKFRKGRSRASARSAKGGGFYLIAILVALLLAWIAPFVAKFLQLAVSREREYLADATAVQFCRNPLALASALKKIAADPEALECDNRATEHMFIINPDPARRFSRADLDSIWSTHPPTMKRIARLRAIAGELENIPQSPAEA